MPPVARTLAPSSRKFGIQIDAQLYLGGTFAFQPHHIGPHTQRTPFLQRHAFPAQVGAPFAKTDPGRPVAVHQHTGLGFHCGAGGRNCIPADPQRIKQRHGNGRAGIAAVGHITALYKVQHDAAVRHRDVIQLTAHKRLGVTQQQGVFFHTGTVLSTVRWNSNLSLMIPILYKVFKAVLK